LTLTPQLQQSIRLLQLSSLELEAEISQALAENPLLERDESPADQVDSDPQREASVDHEDAAPDTELRFDEMPGSGGVYPDDDIDTPARDDTLREHLLLQLSLTRAAPRDAALATLLIDELDDNGYLGSPLDEILQWLPPELEVEEDELRAALSLLQSFDPPGIGARDMAECLLLQLRQPDIGRLPEAAQPAVLACARQICMQHLALLATGNPARLREILRVDEATLRLREHDDGDVIGDALLVDELAHEVEVGLRRGRKTDLDLLEADLHQLFEEAHLALHAHGLDQGLVAVAQVGAHPDRRLGDPAAGPGALGEIPGEGLERHVFGGGVGKHRYTSIGFG
jgi:hypothetical protein